MSRCMCCDRQLKSSEIIWYELEQRHEELCGKCRAKVFEVFIESDWDVERIGMHVDDMMEVTKDEDGT